MWGKAGGVEELNAEDVQYACVFYLEELNYLQYYVGTGGEENGVRAD